MCNIEFMQPWLWSDHAKTQLHQRGIAQPMVHLLLDLGASCPNLPSTFSCSTALINSTVDKKAPVCLSYGLHRLKG